MSIATKTGDDGTTSLLYGRRVSKTHGRVEACGAVDELNAALGLVRATACDPFITGPVFTTQNELVTLMGELAVDDADRERYAKTREFIGAESVDRLTALIDDLEKNHKLVFKHWATPGATPGSASLDVARTVCRRAEREVIRLAGETGTVNPQIIRYLNRLSDLCWLYARFLETKDESSHSPMTNLAESKSKLREFLVKKSVCRGDFTLASGAKSDLYIDAKLTTLDPAMALLAGNIGWETIQGVARSRNLHIDAIGGLTMGADPIALAIGIAASIKNPGAAPRIFSVRKKSKEHGRQKLIEGNFDRGAVVVVIDDVVTTGGSTLQAIDAVEAEGGKVAFVLALVDRQEGGRQNIEARGHHVETIFTRENLLGGEAA